MKKNDTFMLFGGIALIAIGLIIIFMNTRVYFRLYAFPIGGAHISSGLLIIPLLISTFMLVAMENKWPGRIVLWASLLSILIALILSVDLRLTNTTLFNLILMLLPIVIGLGLIVKSSISVDKKDKKDK